ncbi:MAG: hypothetical protein M1822_003979 [Bathelium mastoideum]|nr:MAG: hypothetical protein M1822_003979 [Bathelium mastoideum]
MSQATVPKFLIPHGRQYLHPSVARHAFGLTPNRSRRHASASSKPLVLEKPLKFNPPSHPSRLRTRRRVYPGPPLSEQERQAQKTKWYPHMMPPEGTFMNWFLRDRSIHVWISMSVLMSLAFYVFITEFVDKTTLKDLLPTREEWRLHPIKSFKRFWSVYKLHVEKNSAEVAERRRQQTEDVQKRREYRQAHGIQERQLPFGLGLATEEEKLQRAAQNTVEESPIALSQSETQGEDGSHVGTEVRRKPVKRWLGIWE